MRTSVQSVVCFSRYMPGACPCFFSLSRARVCVYACLCLCVCVCVCVCVCTRVCGSDHCYVKCMRHLPHAATALLYLRCFPNSPFVSSAARLRPVASVLCTNETRDNAARKHAAARAQGKKKTRIGVMRRSGHMRMCWWHRSGG